MDNLYFPVLLLVLFASIDIGSTNTTIAPMGTTEVDISSQNVTDVDTIVNGTTTTVPGNSTHSTTPSQNNNNPPIDLLPIDNGIQECDQETQTGCNVTNLERCVLIRERAPRCVCLGGYSRGPDSLTCVPVKAFQSTLEALNLYTDDLDDRSSSEYRNLEYQAREGLFQAFKESKLRTITSDIRITGLEKTASDRVLINFDILVSRVYAPAADMLEEDAREGIQNVLVNAPGTGNAFLDGTTILLERNKAGILSVNDVDPCSDPLMNYCGQNSVCTRTSRSFVCSCREGYNDVSPNKLEAPGEKCVASCECKNDGECMIDEDGDSYCKCPAWFIGKECEIDGQILLIVVASVLGALLIICLIACCCCIYRLRSRNKVRDDRSMESMNRYKMPRAWLDTWKYYQPHQPYPMYWGRPYEMMPYQGQQPYHTMPALPPPKGDSKANSWFWSDN